MMIFGIRKKSASLAYVMINIEKQIQKMLKNEIFLEKLSALSEYKRFSCSEQMLYAFNFFNFNNDQLVIQQKIEKKNV